jgi:hypothetical protein
LFIDTPIQLFIPTRTQSVHRYADTVIHSYKDTVCSQIADTVSHSYKEMVC